MSNPSRTPPVRLAWLAVAAWAGTIFFLSSLTGREIERIAPFSFWDKAMHFSAYAAGGVVLAAALRWSFAWTWKKIIVVGTLALSLYGVSDEIHQMFTPFRSADVSDWIADTLGGFVGLTLFHFFHARLQPARQSAPPGA